MTDWQFFWCSLAAPDFTVAGVPFEDNVFVRFRDMRQLADVIDPIYGKRCRSHIYALDLNGATYEVAYHEHTPGVYLAFARSETLPFCRPKFRWDSEQRWSRIDNASNAS